MGYCFLYKRGSGSGGSNRPVIVKTALGSVISLTDSTNGKLKGLRIFGKTTQNGTPSPDAPVPLESVGNDGNVIVFVGKSQTDANPQSATFDTPNGLPGIAVSSGGNYADSTGQQWVCDEIDGARGVYVHRACVESFDGSADEKISYSSNSEIVTNGFVSIELACNGIYAGAKYKPNLLCDRLLTVVNNYGHFEENSCTISSAKNKLTILSSDITSVASAREWLALHPIKVVYEMETPIETPLSAEELAQYAALHTNYPNTTIFNDEGADMEVKYTSGG